jgi:hypothetical protein
MNTTRHSSCAACPPCTWSLILCPTPDRPARPATVSDAVIEDLATQSGWGIA